jgi:uncharacterized protein YeaO (DUF488 family)
MDIRVKSIYAKRDDYDGYRVLVDDYLPDSMDEYKAGVDLWLRKIMPSVGLTNLIENNPDLWDEFRDQYFRELDGEKHCWVKMISEAARVEAVTLYYSCSDHLHNNAVAIREYMEVNMERLGLKAA